MGKKTVTNLSIAGAFSPLASLSNVLLIPSDGARFGSTYTNSQRRSSKDLQGLFPVPTLNWPEETTLQTENKSLSY